MTWTMKDLAEAYKQYLTIRWKHDKKIPTWGKVVKNIDSIFGGNE